MRTRLKVTSIEESTSGETWLRVRVPAGVTVPSIFDASWSVEMTTPDRTNPPMHEPWPPPVKRDRPAFWEGNPYTS